MQRHIWAIFLRNFSGLFLFTKIEEEDIGKIWFQQDGATCHTLDVLRCVFEDHINTTAELMYLAPSELQFDTVGKIR